MAKAVIPTVVAAKEFSGYLIRRCVGVAHWTDARNQIEDADVIASGTAVGISVQAITRCIH